MTHYVHSYLKVTVLIQIFFIQACATPQQTATLFQSPPDIPAFRELTSAPFYPQQDYQCGPAALATAINFHRQQTNPDELKSMVYIPQLKGSLQIEMLAAPRQFNRLAIKLDGKLESILKEINHGIPVLIMQNLGLESIPFWHYAVAIGYDMDKQQILLRSGEIERLSRPFSIFERTWKQSDYWSVVIVPPGIIPITVSLEKYTQATIDLESSTSPDNSILAYQAGTKRWPDSFLLQMGLGNVSYTLRNYSTAETAFLTAIELKPGRAEAWNNLAYTLAKLGKKNQANNAITRAIKLAPDNIEYKNSLLEISNF